MSNKLVMLKFAVVSFVVLVLVACGSESTDTSSGSSDMTESTGGSTQTADDLAAPTQEETSSENPLPEPASQPTLRFVGLADNDILTTVENFGVEVVAEDDGSIENVSLYLDNDLVRVESFMPYLWGAPNEVAFAREVDGAFFSARLTNGEHQLRAVVVDNDGLISEQSITINIATENTLVIDSEEGNETPSTNTPPDNSTENDTNNSQTMDLSLASRVSGVAPLSVHFDSGYENENFHNYHFEWDFGDTEAGFNAHNGLNKNNDTGPISAYLYERPGTYNVTLTIRNASGIVERKLTTITVTNADFVFSGTNTKCIAKENNFIACPQGAEQLIYSDSQMESGFYSLMAIPNTRILLRRGDSWDLTGTSWPIVSDIYIGAYGECAEPDIRGICDNAPVLRGVGTNYPTMLDFRKGSENIILEDINLTAINSSVTASIHVSGIDNFIINRVKSTVVSALTSSGMDDSAVYNSDFSGGIVVVYIDGQRMVMKNNTFHGSTGSHVVRFPIARKFVFTHNEVHSSTIGTPAGTGPGLLVKLHSLHEGDLCNTQDGRTDWCNRFVQGSSPESRYSTEYVYIANNLFGRGSNWGVAVLAQNGAYAERLSWILFEKNRNDWTYGNQNAKGAMTHALTIQATNSVVRNNLFDTEGVPGYTRVINVIDWNPHFPSDGLEIYNNTINASSVVTTQTPFIAINVGANQRNTTIKNNLIVRPADPNGVAVRNDGINTVGENNLYVDDAQFIDVTGPPRNRSYMLNSGSPALNAGDNSVPVLDDFDGVLRRGGNVGNMDVGAYEQ